MIYLLETSHSPDDKGKVRLAVGLRRVDPADVPATAKAAPPQPSTANVNKRKANDAMPSSAQAASSSSSRLNPSLGRIPYRVDEEDNAGSNDTVDELYCTLRTNIVGVQYYKGSLLSQYST